jgi:TM2 domain-containing membrane protein YozV
MSEAVSRSEKSLASAWIAGLCGWLLPGAGHFWLGRIWHGIILGSVVWITFLMGLWFGGHLYSLFDSTTGMLSYVFGFFDVGAGLLYAISRATEIGVAEQAQLPTSEYGNVFLMIAGLLNYLLALDAFDIAIGRKP